jgi:hypothetical protein
MVAVAFLDLFHDLVLRAVKHVQRDTPNDLTVTPALAFALGIEALVVLDEFVIRQELGLYDLAPIGEHGKPIAMTGRLPKKRPVKVVGSAKING